MINKIFNIIFFLCLGFDLLQCHHPKIYVYCKKCGCKKKKIEMKILDCLFFVTITKKK